MGEIATTVVRAVTLPVREVVKPCVVCGMEFVPGPKAGGQKVCGDVCRKARRQQAWRDRERRDAESRQAYQRARRAARKAGLPTANLQPVRPRKCRTCGAEFLPSGPSSHVCGEGCRKALAAMRSRESYRRNPERKKERSRSRLASLSPEKRAEVLERKRAYCAAWRARQQPKPKPATELTPEEREQAATAKAERAMEVRRKANDRMKERYKTDPEYRAKVAERNARPEVRAKRLASTRAWQEANYERFREHVREYRIRKRIAQLMTATATLKESLSASDQTADPRR